MVSKICFLIDREDMTHRNGVMIEAIENGAVANND